MLLFRIEYSEYSNTVEYVYLDGEMYNKYLPTIQTDAKRYLTAKEYKEYRSNQSSIYSYLGTC